MAAFSVIKRDANSRIHVIENEAKMADEKNINVWSMLSEFFAAPETAGK